MADVAFDTAAARADGVSDAEIAAFLAPKVGFDLGTARKDGVPDSAIVDFLAPVKAAEPAPPPPEPVSGTAKGMLKAAGQETIQSAAETVSGVGAVTKMAGGAERQETKVDLSLMNRLDKGEDFGTLMKAAPNDLARLALREYQVADPDQRAKIRQSAFNTIAAPEGQVELTGEHIMKAGEKLGDYAKTAIPLTPEEESRSTVIATKMVAGLTKYIGAAIAGGMPAVVGVAGVDAFGQTYDKARIAGRTDDEAMGDALINGMVQGGLMAVPIGQATKVFDLMPVALKGDFMKALAEAGKSGLTLTAFSQISTIADNVVAKSTYDPARKPLEGVGEHLPETFAAGAFLPLVGHGAARLLRGKTPVETVRPVLDAPDVDTAIAKAREVAEGTPVDVESIAAQAREFGGEAEQRQAKLLQLFGGLNEGTVEVAPDGSYHYRTAADGKEQTVPLEVWDGKAKPAAEGEEPAPTISPALVAAQRAHYDKLGVKIVYFENDPGIAFDGAVSPQAPNTIFLSNNPTRNAAQVGAHELTHLFEDTKLPDGTNLGDLLHNQVAEGITNEGLDYAGRTFGETAPDRGQFPRTPEGDAAHADAVVAHLVRELGADIGAEAPKFQTFVPQVVGAVEQRFGRQIAKDVLRKLIEGIRQTMATMRAFFSKPAEGAEYGQPETVSQKWVTNLEQIHGTLARMYAERYASQVERERAALEAMRPKPAAAAEVVAPQATPAETAPAVKPAPVEAAAAPPERPAPAPAAPEPVREPAPPPPAVAEPPPVELTQLQKEQAAVRAMRPAPEVPEPLPPPAPPPKAETPARIEHNTFPDAAAEGRAAALAGESRALPRGYLSPAMKALQGEWFRAYDAAKAEAETKPARTPPAKGGLEEIGRNHLGQVLFEDARGVRSIVRDGVRVNEPVGIKPGTREISTDRTNRPEYLTAEEHAQRPPEARPEPKPESPPAREAAPEHRFAEELADMLDRSGGGRGGVTGRLKLAGGDVQRLADRVFGGTLGEGAYTRDRLYDAMELGVNRYIQRHPERFSAAVDAARAKEVAAELASLKESLPTQTVRAGEKDAYQQFSTPPDYAYAANWVANLRPTDHVLEPSAGVGGLIVHAMTSGVRETTVNELSDKRRGMIAALEPSRITGEDAAQLHNILPSEVRPTVVVMNPPFSRSAERMGGKMVQDEGAKHIEQALARLEPGGRLVAIVGDGMKPEGTAPQGGARQGTGKAFRDWWTRIGKEYDVLANVGVDRDIYTKYGTSFPTRFLVIDKRPPSGREMITGQVKDAAGLIEHLKEVRDERSTIEPLAGEPSRAEVAEGRGRPGGRDVELPGAVGVVGTGEGRRAGEAAGVTESAAAPRSGATDRGTAEREGRGRDEVVPVEPGSADRGADEGPRPEAAGRDEPGAGRGDRGTDGIRPDGRGERDEPGVTPASEDVLATENAVSKPDNREISEAVYEPYKPQRITIAGAKAHPGALVQSAAMASVLPPKTDYKPKLPQALVKSGALSDAQLEAIVYAGHAHSDVMPNGKRRGFFIGDGTGVGKGREIAGILLDNKQQGRTKAVWISEKPALLNDARRDWNGVGQPGTEIFAQGKTKAGDAINPTKGILFTTYATLRSAEQTKVEGEKVKGKTRVDQIVEWVGKDFDGVIAFDEAHNMGNASAEKGDRGVKQAAQQALAGLELQEKLPNARVVYVSATGATEVTNFAYLDRLGLWGEGTSFPNRQDFIAKVSDGGMAAMELAARDMKALGHYISRNLSYDGVEYARVEHKLTPDQRAIYDKLADGWQVVLQNFNEALGLTGANLDRKTRSALLSQFWSGHQRFFNQVITSMQMPSVLKAVEKDLKEGRQSVLQLVNTNEASQERALEKAKAKDGGDLEDLDMTPRDQLMQMVEKSYPVQQFEKYIDENGNERSRPVVDSNGNPVLNKEAVARRERLLDELGSLRVPEGPLEMLLNKFGPDVVAEITGRGQRVVRKPDESGEVKAQLEKRGAQSNITDANDFQAGKKPILVFSMAGGTGRSYHAEIGTGAEGARRSHYLVQGGWQADKAVQGFGRTHRTSQASAPIFNLVTTDLQGQKRFISSIARRLGQLGALTKGERRTGDQGMFGMRDNLESGEAKAALVQFFKDVAGGHVEGVDMNTLETGMGLKMRDENGALRSDLPPMTQFLNRVLSLKIDDQNRVFDAFSERLDDVIDKAAAAGTLDTGVETYKADKISKVSEQVVYTDPRSGAETKHVHLNAQSRNNPASFGDTVAGRNKTNGKKPDYFIQNERSGNVFAVTEAGTRTLENGNVIEQLRLTSPTDYQFVERDTLKGENWKKLSSEQARPLWDDKVASTPEFRNSDLHVITGAVLPIWDRLGGSPKIYRLQTDEKERMLGRVIPAKLVDQTLNRLGAEGLKVDAAPGEIGDRVLKGATAELANGWTIKPARVAGEQRLELVGPNYTHNDELSRHGIFSERIDYKTRYFIPTGKDAAAAIEAITKSRPVTSLSNSEGPKFSPKQPESPEFKRWFEGSKAVDEKTGKPLVVYHGTPEEVQGGVFKAPAFFTEQAKESEFYSMGRHGRDGGRTYAVYLDIKNPLDARTREGSEELIGIAERAGVNLETDIREGGGTAWNFHSEDIKRETPYDGSNVNDLMYLPKVREQMRKEGYDGLRAWDGGGMDFETPIWVPLDPGQIKSAIGNTGTFDATNPDIRFSPKREEPFYSALTRGVEGLKVEKASPGQWEATIRNMPGIKAEERAWVGLDDWLRQQPKSVTKAEVLDYLRAHEVKVQEVQKGGSVPREAVDAIREWAREEYGEPDAQAEFTDAVLDGIQQGDAESIRSAESFGVPGKLMQPIYDSIAGGATKHGTHVLPGGENYRELLLTLPEKPGERGPKGWGDTAGGTSDTANFRGGHWDEPNVLAHVRFDDRAGPNGEKVLHVAEVQSDWHQKGRKQGYRESEVPNPLTADERKQLRSYITARPGELTEQELAHRHELELRERPHNEAADKVPDAPFKTTWPELAMKRVIRYAAENGYDRVSWDTGTTNADRYDLSKQVRELTYTGGERLIATGHKGETLINTVVKPEGLPDVIGKEAADKLLAQKPHRYSGDVDNNTRHLTGTDLKLGGEGMAAFYDKQLPIIANKIGKRFDAKVEDFTIAQRDAAGRFATADDADAKYTSHSLPITDAMRESVMQGQPLFSPKITGENKARAYTPEQEQAFENVGRTVEPPRMAAWLANARQDLGKKIARDLVDPYIGLKESNPQGYMAARIANSSGGAVETFLEHGTLKFSGAAYDWKDRNGGVVNHLMKPLGDEAHDFMWWVAGHRAERLKAEDRENLFSESDIDALKTLNRGTVDFDYKLPNGRTTRSKEAIYADSLRKLDVFNRNVMDLAVDSGLLKREQVDALWSNPFYVPFYRQAEESGSRSFVGPNISSGFIKQNAFKALKGGTEKLNSDLWQNAFGNWEHMIDASIRNKAGRENLDFASSPGVDAAQKLSLQQVRYMSDKQVKAETAWVMEDGEKQHYRVTDPFLLQAVSALNAGDKSGAIMRVGQGFAKLLRMGVTSSPFFAVRNIVRDTEQTLAVSPLGFNVAKNLYTGFKMNDLGGELNNLGRAMAGRETQAPKMSDEALSAMAGGGLMRIGAASESGISTPKVSRILNTPDSINALWGYVDKTARAYRSILNQGEDVNRLALYKKLVGEGMDHDAASFASRDLMDFTLHGAAPLVRAITSLVPFQNAWMQGLYKVGRSAVDADKSVFAAVGGRVAWQTTKRVATVWGAMALLTMAMDAYYADDPDYKNRTEFDRNSNWWFKIGSAEVRIPMGFEIAAASRIAANGAEVFFDKEMTGKRFMQNLWSILGTNMSLNPIPQAVKPLLDVAENQSRVGSPITPRGLERLRSEDQYTANNTMAARGVSSVLNAGLRAVPGNKVEGPSPIQIDYLVQAYGGWLATSILGLADTAVRSFTSEPARPASDIVSAVTQNMVSTTPTSQRSGRYVNLLYDQAEGIERAYASYMDKIRQGRTEEAREFFADNKDLIQKHGLVASVTRLEGDLNRQIRLVTNNPDPAMTPERKRLAIMQIQATKNRAAEQAMGVR